MRSTWPALTLTVLIAATAGCADLHSGPPVGISSPSSSSATASRAFPVEFSRTGGLIGVNEQVSISADGRIMITRDGTAGTPLPLDETTFVQLEQLLTDVPAAGPSSMPSSTGVCADGYQYQLRTPTWSATTDDCSLRNRPAIAPVVRLLTPLLGATIAAPSSTTSPR